MAETTSGDVLGSILFYGKDSTDSTEGGAQIRATQVGAAGTNNLPTKLEFITTSASAMNQTPLTLESDGSATFAGTVDAKGLIHKFGLMSTGAIGDVFDSTIGTRLCIQSVVLSDPMLSLGYYSSGYGLDIWLMNTNPLWDAYYDNRSDGRSHIFRNNTGSDGNETVLATIGDNATFTGGVTAARFNSSTATFSANGTTDVDTGLVPIHGPHFVTVSFGSTTYRPYNSVFISHYQGTNVNNTYTQIFGTAYVILTWSGWNANNLYFKTTDASCFAAEVTIKILNLY
jgi:hypothetical protein